MPDSRPTEARTARFGAPKASAPPGASSGPPRKAGRPKGSLNKATKEVRAALRSTLPKARRRLRALVESDDPDIAFKAVTLIFAYTYGKPTERRELSGAEGGPMLLDFLRGLPG